MSRSIRKRPVRGVTSCHSERDDKRLWHRRWRAHERRWLSIIPLDDSDSPLPVSVKQLSNPWAMGKDGRQYWLRSDLDQMVDFLAKRKGRNHKETSALRERAIRKFHGK